MWLLLLKYRYTEERLLLGFFLLFLLCFKPVSHLRRTAVVRVRGWVRPEVIGNSGSSGRWHACICDWMSAFPYSINNIWNQWTARWLLPGSSQWEVNSLFFACPQPLSCSPLTSPLLLQCHISFHPCSESLVSCRQMCIHMEPFSETGKVCERLFSMAVVPGRITTQRKRRSMKWRKASLPSHLLSVVLTEDLKAWLGHVTFCISYLSVAAKRRRQILMFLPLCECLMMIFRF